MNKHLFMTFGILAAFSLFCGCASVSKGDVNMGYDQGISEAPWVSDGENYQYDSVTEQGFCDAQTQPSSYFSLDRNTAGYSLVRTQVKNGLQIAPDSVRLEEMVNYFDYDYPAPEKGEGVSLSAYLSDCPWKEDHRLMTVGVRTEEAEQGGDANYVLLVDVSGSMGSAVYGYEGMSCLDLVRYGANKMVDGLDENRMQQLIAEKNELQAKLGEIAEERGRQQTVQDWLETIYTVLDGLKNHPITYDDEVVRRLIDCVVVESKDRIKVVFCGGLQVEQQLRQEEMDFLSEMGPMPVNM